MAKRGLHCLIVIASLLCGASAALRKTCDGIGKKANRVPMVRRRVRGLRPSGRGSLASQLHSD